MGHIEKNLFGFYNYMLGSNLNNKFTKWTEYLSDHYDEEHDIKLEETIKLAKTLLIWDDILTARTFGYGNIENYYNKASCYHNLPHIRIPTMLLMAKDDPIIGPDAICYEITKSNPHLLMGVTERGGHLGYFESVFSTKQWFTKPVIEFLKAHLNE
jgi:predicted alpha/beta-fold hydrolase